MPGSSRRIAYLAGPEVFRPDAAAVGQAKIAICRRHELEARFPLPDESELPEGPPDKRGLAIFEFSMRVIGECQLLIANMTPFRGVSLDVGTAIEMGYAFGKGLKVFGYTNVVEDYAARVANDGLDVESFGFADNLMCEGLVRRSGGNVVRPRAQPGTALADLTTFEECVAQAASVLGLVSARP